MPIDLENNLRKIKQNIEALEKRYNRPPGNVRLIAVSKTRSIEEVCALAKCGQKDFAENYVQEAVEKITNIHDYALTWHFIGPIQKNKTRLIAEHFSWIHSIDREVIATRLSDQRPPSLKPINVCIQVNIDNENSKSGIPAHKLLDLAESIRILPQLNLRGLMAIPSSQQDFEKQCDSFNKMRNLLDLLQKNNFITDTLSMGMSNDYEAAISCDTTMLRIGTALFGPRSKA